jgi:hypothetical protein
VCDPSRLLDPSRQNVTQVRRGVPQDWPELDVDQEVPQGETCRC